MPAQTRIAALSLACLLSPAVIGCADSTIEDYPPDEMYTILDDLDLVTPAQTDVEPTGQACETYGSAALCRDGESAAFCNFNFENVDTLTYEFGGCVHYQDIECVPGEVKTVTDWCGELQATCGLDDTGPTWFQDVCDEGGDTPLVLRFDDAPITMIDAEATPAATFDIAMSADQSSCITTDWPSAATPWLAADLDRNGSIDGGHELFGSGTDLQARWREGFHHGLLAHGKAKHGFLALAAYDDNHDGLVDARDAGFATLLLWRDDDADRRSSPDELQTLTEAGVDSLAVNYVIDRQCDDRGNCGVQRAPFSHAGGRGEIVDLYLACQ